jgi:hypothetical protein
LTASGALTGTAGTAGSFTFTLRVSIPEAQNAYVDRAFTTAVAVRPVFSTAALANTDFVALVDVVYSIAASNAASYGLSSTSSTISGMELDTLTGEYGGLAEEFIATTLRRTVVFRAYSLYSTAIFASKSVAFAYRPNNDMYSPGVFRSEGSLNGFAAHYISAQGFKATLQNDGNFVVYRESDNAAMWGANGGGQQSRGPFTMKFEYTNAQKTGCTLRVRANDNSIVSSTSTFNTTSSTNIRLVINNTALVVTDGFGGPVVYYFWRA